MMDEKNSMKKIYLISVEGLIGAGKTTVLSKLQEIVDQKEDIPFSVLIIRECLEEFTKFHEYNPLQLAYENPTANAATAQIHFTQCINKLFSKTLSDVMQSPMKDWKNDTLVVITDRGLFSPIPFINTLFVMGRINHFVRDFLSDYTLTTAERNLNDLHLSLDGIYFVDTPVDICMKRLARRGRNFECKGGAVSYEYQKTLKEQYEQQFAGWPTKTAIKNALMHRQKIFLYSSKKFSL